MTREVDLAWAAGLFEGEGCISLNHTERDKPFPRLFVMSTDKDVLERFAGIVTPDREIRPYRDNGKLSKKPSWYWQMGIRDEVERILMLFMPHLGERRRNKAVEALECIAYLRVKADRRRRGDTARA